MAGYSAAALEDLTDGDRLEVLLFDAGHFEAMLSGLVPPEELLGLAHDHASYLGAGHAPLETLLDRGSVLPKVEFDSSATFPEGLLADDARPEGAEVLFTLSDSAQLGVAAVGGDRVLVTTQVGIVEVDLASRSVNWAVPVAGCHRNPVVCGDGSIAFTRRLGVARYLDGRLVVLGGALFGNTCLVPHPDGTLWAFANGDISGPPGASITRLGEFLGDQVHYELDYPGAAGFTSAWVSETDLLTTGPYFLVTSLEAGSTRRVDVRQANPMGLAVLADGTVMSAGDSTTLVRTDLDAQESLMIARLNLRPSVNELCLDGAGGLYIASYFGDGPMNPIAVARFPVAGLVAEQECRQEPPPVDPVPDLSLEEKPPPSSQTERAGDDRGDETVQTDQEEGLLPVREPNHRRASLDALQFHPPQTRWRVVKGGPETAGLSNGLRETIGPHLSSGLETSPSLRIGVAIASGQLPLAGLETRQIRAHLLELLRQPPIAPLIAVVNPELPTLAWQSYGNGGRTSYAAILSGQAVAEPPLAWVRLILPQPDEVSFGRDNRCANFILHMDWRTLAGVDRKAIPLEQWQSLMGFALSLPTVLTDFLSGELNLPIAEDPPAKIGFWLSSPPDSNLASLVDLDGRPRIAGSSLSRWFDAYAIADDSGELSNDLTRPWITHLSDEYLHLD
jgi:hypothetical protein